MRQHNIISAIPRTDQTDAAKFPPYEYQEFPKMLIGKDGKNICDSNSNPRVFQTERELEEFLDSNPSIAEEVREKELSSAKNLEMENDVLKKLLAENERLMKRNKELEAAGDDDEDVEEATAEEDPPPKRRTKRRNRDKPLKMLK